MSDDILAYQLNGKLVAVNNIQTVLDKAFQGIKQQSGEAYDRAVAENIDLTVLPASLKEVMALNKTGAGIDPSLGELLVWLAGSEAVRAVGRDLWKKVFLPYLIAKFGNDAIKPKKPVAPAPKKTKDS